MPDIDDELQLQYGVGDAVDIDDLSGAMDKVASMPGDSSSWEAESLESQEHQEEDGLAAAPPVAADTFARGDGSVNREEELREIQQR